MKTQAVAHVPRRATLAALATANRSLGRQKTASFHPWLHGAAVFTAFSILVLICSGGLVTSKGAGLTVPDWPTTYGYNMFAFPVSRWVGGIFLEHTHRLLASVVGLLTVGLTVLTLTVERRRWVRWLGVAATFAVVCQGVLGGLRVVWLKDYIGIFHAGLAQAFLVMVSLLALVTSALWLRPRLCLLEAEKSLRLLRAVALTATVLIYAQLLVGASMRHAHAGLSIPDFPRTYGAWWPATDAASLQSINAARDAAGQPPTTSLQILLQMAHRIGAGLIACAVLAGAALAWRETAPLPGGVRRLALGWPGLIALQIAFGIYTIWTNKAADVATAHVAIGALSLVWGATLSALLINDARAAVFARRAAEGAGNPAVDEATLEEVAV